MEMTITFPGGKRVDARFGDHVVRTDQPAAAGGADEAPAPFDLFLASIGTCAGIYVLAFCQARGIPTEDVALVERVTTDPATRLPSKIEVEVVVPPGFPAKDRAAVKRAAELCKVKRVLAAPPDIRVSVRDAVEASAAA